VLAQLDAGLSQQHMMDVSNVGCTNNDDRQMLWHATACNQPRQHMYVYTPRSLCRRHELCAVDRPGGGMDCLACRAC
jgi:hypothetical protein